MNKNYREKLMREIAMKVDVDMCLEYLIERYSKDFKDLNVTKEDFTIRLAKTPEEACYRSTIITIPKTEMNMNELEIRDKAKYYDSLLNEAFKGQYEFMNPENIGNIKSWEGLEEILKGVKR